MNNLEDLEKKINSELTTKINSTKIKHNHLYIDIDNIYKDSFTLCHVAEQEVGVNYRFLKKNVTI